MYRPNLSTFDHKNFGASKIDLPLDQHVVECFGALTVFNYIIIGKCQNTEKLMTIENLIRRKPKLKTRDEYK